MREDAKKIMRSKVRRILGEMSQRERIEASIEIVEKLVDLVRMMRQPLSRPLVIASFRGLAAEPDLRRLHLELDSSDFHLVYPVCEDDRSLAFYHVKDPDDQLIKGSYGISEPDPSCCGLVAASEVDVFLVPALAYTKDGERLGKGGGYYDTTLSSLSGGPQTVGVAFECQILERIPTEPHDVRVSQVIAL